MSNDALSIRAAMLFFPVDCTSWNEAIKLWRSVKKDRIYRDVLIKRYNKETDHTCNTMEAAGVPLWFFGHGSPSLFIEVMCDIVDKQQTEKDRR